MYPHIMAAPSAHFVRSDQSFIFQTEITLRLGSRFDDVMIFSLDRIHVDLRPQHQIHIIQINVSIQMISSDLEPFFLLQQNNNCNIRILQLLLNLIIRLLPFADDLMKRDLLILISARRYLHPAL